MTIVMTPLGALELNIPTIYGSKHQFRSYGGGVYDIPDWLGWVYLIAGLGVGGYVGWMGCNTLVNTKFYKDYVIGTAKSLYDEVLGISKIRAVLSFLGSSKPVVKKKK